jgi:hypothetical protein
MKLTTKTNKMKVYTVKEAAKEMETLKNNLNFWESFVAEDENMKRQKENVLNILNQQKTDFYKKSQYKGKNFDRNGDLHTIEYYRGFEISRSVKYFGLGISN